MRLRLAGSSTFMFFEMANATIECSTFRLKCFLNDGCPWPKIVGNYAFFPIILAVCTPRAWDFSSGSIFFFSRSDFGRGFNPFTTGTSFWGQFYLNFRIGRDLGALKLPN